MNVLLWVLQVLAALLFMAIVIPVAMHGVSVASRAGILGQRKATAMRVAERLLDELIVTDQVNSGATNGSIVEGDTTYPWTVRSEDWPEGEMTQVTVRVSFDVQGNTFEVSASTTRRYCGDAALAGPVVAEVGASRARARSSSVGMSICSVMVSS